MQSLLFVDARNRLLDVQGGDTLGEVEDLGPLIRSGLFTARSAEEMERSFPVLSGKLTDMGFESVMLSEVSMPGRVFGYLVFCPEIHTLHIWQENECTAAFFLSRMLAQELGRAAEESDITE
jgi:hypothetical protein